MVYTPSVIGMMSKAKLKTSEEDEMDLGASGIVVTFKTVKNRIAKPKKIKFEISFIHGMNPYTGLDAFCRPEYFDRIGIAQGKMDVDKKTGEMRFTPGGNRWYVNHLGKSVTTKQLFTPDVFTQGVLENLEPIVNDYFRFKSLDEIEEVEKQFNDAMGIDADDTDYKENVDADDLFS
jgi:hypothetical protein